MQTWNEMSLLHKNIKCCADGFSKQEVNNRTQITFFYLFFFFRVRLSSLLLRARAMFHLINQVCLLSHVQFAA